MCITFYVQHTIIWKLANFGGHVIMDALLYIQLTKALVFDYFSKQKAAGTCCSQN